MLSLIHLLSLHSILTTVAFSSCIQNIISHYFIIQIILWLTKREEEFEFEKGVVVISPNTYFYSLETEFSESSLVFYNSPYLGDVEFESVGIFF